MKQEEIVRVDLLAIYAPPSAEHWLGTRITEDATFSANLSLVHVTHLQLD